MKETKLALLPQKSPGLIKRVKSYLFGGEDSFYDDGQNYVNATNSQPFYQLLNSTHAFSRQSLRRLVEMGYSNSPIGFGIINKILLAQRNINFVPYWNGKPWISKKDTFVLDINRALEMLLLTGTVVIYKKEIVGFNTELAVLNTLNIEEYFVGGKYVYRLYNDDGTWINLINDNMIIIKFYDVARRFTQMGLSPLQAALMPIESLKYMYIADTSTLKNKGVDVLITNDSDQPIVDDQQEMDKSINERIGGARRSGGVATSTAKLRAITLGRSVKELALWDGYKIKIRDFCNALQVDSGQFNDPDNKKFSNVQDSNKALYNDCVIPFTRMITENRDLKNELGFDIYLDISNIDVLQEAQQVKAEKASTITDAIVNLNSQVKSGVITHQIAVRIMVSEWEFDPEEAELMIIPDSPVTTTM